MSTIVPYSIVHHKAGKGYFYLFKYSDFDTILSGMSERPIYVSLHFTMKAINKSDAMQLNGQWSLGYFYVPSFLSEPPDKDALGIHINVRSLPYSVFADAQIDRQAVKQICLDQMKLFFEKALTLDISNIQMVLLVRSKSIDFKIQLGASSKHINISIENT